MLVWPIEPHRRGRADLAQRVGFAFFVWKKMKELLPFVIFHVIIFLYGIQKISRILA